MIGKLLKLIFSEKQFSERDVIVLKHAYIELIEAVSQLSQILSLFEVNLKQLSERANADLTNLARVYIFIYFIGDLSKSGCDTFIKSLFAFEFWNTLVKLNNDRELDNDFLMMMLFKKDLDVSVQTPFIGENFVLKVRKLFLKYQAELEGGTSAIESELFEFVSGATSILEKNVLGEPLERLTALSVFGRSFENYNYRKSRQFAVEMFKESKQFNLFREFFILTEPK